MEGFVLDADEYISYADIAAALGDIAGKHVTVTAVETDEAIELGLAPRVAHSHRWLTDVGYPARPEMLASSGIEPLPLRDWIRRHIDQIEIGISGRGRP